jgi:3-hydroxybutyryl-CoA dehydratase
MREISLGDAFVHERAFDDSDVRAFTSLTGDAGAHHLTPGAFGRLLVHGILTASIPTKIGGDLDLLAREMHF